MNDEANYDIVEVLEAISKQLFDLEKCLASNNADLSAEEEYVRTIKLYVDGQLLGYKTLYGLVDNTTNNIKR